MLAISTANARSSGSARPIADLASGAVTGIDIPALPSLRGARSHEWSEALTRDSHPTSIIVAYRAMPMPL
jgi:hypothetical protein